MNSCFVHVQQHAPPQIAGAGHPCSFVSFLQFSIHSCLSLYFSMCPFIHLTNFTILFTPPNPPSCTVVPLVYISTCDSPNYSDQSFVAISPVPGLRCRNISRPGPSAPREIIIVSKAPHGPMYPGGISRGLVVSCP